MKKRGSLTFIKCLTLGFVLEIPDPRAETGRDRGEAMPEREIIIVKREQIMAETFGHSKDLITLSFKKCKKVAGIVQLFQNL